MLSSKLCFLTKLQQGGFGKPVTQIDLLGSLQNQFEIVINKLITDLVSGRALFCTYPAFIGWTVLELLLPLQATSLQ